MIDYDEKLDTWQLLTEEIRRCSPVKTWKDVKTNG